MSKNNKNQTIHQLEISATFFVKKGKIYRIAIEPRTDNALPYYKIEGEVSDELKNNISEAIDAFTQGNPIPELPLAWDSLTPFTRRVLLAIAEIPRGKVQSYKDIACKLQAPDSARAVGQACGRNPFMLIIPCHRVISSDGTIGGFGYPIEFKKYLLSLETGFP